jgi:hypothetical protein
MSLGADRIHDFAISSNSGNFYMFYWVQVISLYLQQKNRRITFDYNKETSSFVYLV